MAKSSYFWSACKAVQARSKSLLLCDVWLNGKKLIFWSACEAVQARSYMSQGLLCNFCNKMTTIHDHISVYIHVHASLALLKQVESTGAGMTVVDWRRWNSLQHCVLSMAWSTSWFNSLSSLFRVIEYSKWDPLSYWVTLLNHDLPTPGPP